jgi:hypothetical protein
MEIRMARTAKKKAEADATMKPAQAGPAPAAQPQPQPESITIADIQKLAACVDLAFRRGAFGAAEASEVGQVYNKVAGFLALVAAQQKEAAQEENKNG